ncbi:alpha/beta hydrolase [Nocardia mexicana]|uniref:alpha/beta hydrolase n=1 Tax=Nocardia mexicana TaxID=279262 RepID=UPI001471F1C6|nr:alpha/beta hydrolase fold domain-containing protein [Nocardia mexicana]
MNSVVLSGRTVTDGLVVEWFGPASRRTRLINALLRPVARSIIEVSSVVARPWNMRLAAVTDLPGALLRLPPDITVRPVHLPDLDLEWVWRSEANPETADRAVLYFHGGAFAAGGLRTFRGMAARLSGAVDTPVCMVGFRMLPTPLPAIVDDGVRAYRYLLSRGFSPDRIVCAGDSSGGGLAFAVLLAARVADLPLPGGVIAVSPWADFDCAAKFESPNRRSEVFLSATAMRRLVRRFIVDAGRGLRAASPVDGELRGFPPVLIQASTSELLRCDAELMARRLADAGAVCRLQLWDRQPHSFPVYGVLPESAPALAEMARFVRELPAGRAAPKTDELQENS